MKKSCLEKYKAIMQLGIQIKAVGWFLLSLTTNNSFDGVQCSYLLKIRILKFYHFLYHHILSGPTNQLISFTNAVGLALRETFFVHPVCLQHQPCDSNIIKRFEKPFRRNTTLSSSCQLKHFFSNWLMVCLQGKKL